MSKDNKKLKWPLLPNYTPSVLQKWCIKCNRRLPIFDFRTDSTKTLGIGTYCKKCDLEYGHRYRKSHKYKTRNRSRERKREKTRYLSPRRFNLWKQRIEGRGKSWTLTKEEYDNLSGKRCHYCKGPLPERGVGLDRLDNSKGYSADNVVPCCTICNRARLDHFSPEEMEKHIGPAIRKIRKDRGLGPQDQMERSLTVRRREV